MAGGPLSMMSYSLLAFGFTAANDA